MSHYSLLSLAVLLLAISASESQRQYQFDSQNAAEYCSNGYIHLPETSKCYKFAENRVSHHVASTSCALTGGRLASVYTDTEKRAIVEYVNDNFPGVFWTAGHSDNRGNYYWDGGISVQNAFRGRTFRTAANMCVYLCSITHKVWDAPCSSHKGFVCVKNTDSIEVATIGAV